MPTIQQQALQSETPAYLELFDVDLVKFGGPVLYLTPTIYPDGTLVAWRGITYTSMAMQATGFEWLGDSTQPPNPILTISNVNNLILPYILNYGDFVGAKVTRWRTFKNYLDGEANADPDQHFPPDIYYIEQITGMTNESIIFLLSAAIDQLVGLPRRLVLTDPVNGNPGFPGVNRVKV